MGAPRIIIDAAAREHGRYLYEETLTPVADIAPLLNVSRSTLFIRIKEWGWQRRLQVAPRLREIKRAAESNSLVHPAATPASDASATANREPSGVTTSSGAARAPTDFAAVTEQVARTVERELDAIEAVLAKLPPSDERGAQVERAARTLASLTRTLHEVRRISAMHAADEIREADSQENDDDMPRDIDEFRRELARRIDAFVASHADAEISHDRD